MKTILVADDFQTSRKVIVNALSRAGFQTLEAGDGTEALSLMDGRPIDMLVTDFNMPNMDGAELIANMRKQDDYCFLPALVLSTEIKAEKKQRAEAAKITAWIQKPFDLDKFIKIVHKALK